MNEPTTVTYSIAEVLKGIEDKFNKIDGKLETIQKDVTDLKVGVATLTEKVNNIDKRLEKAETTQDTLVKEVSDLKGVKSLIIPIVVAVITACLTFFVQFIPNIIH